MTPDKMSAEMEALNPRPNDEFMNDMVTTRMFREETIRRDRMSVVLGRLQPKLKQLILSHWEGLEIDGFIGEWRVIARSDGGRFCVGFMSKDQTRYVTVIGDPSDTTKTFMPFGVRGTWVELLSMLDEVCKNWNLEKLVRIPRTPP